MESGDNKRALIVGIFLALGIVIFVVGIFTVGSQQKSFVSGITIKAVFDDVAGLKKGNNVVFSGVKVGTISNIKFSGISQVQVTMSVEKATQQYIHRNASVKISTDGLIGNKIIVIDGGSPNAPEVQDGDALQAEKLLSTDDIMKTLQVNNTNLVAITGDIRKITRMMADGKGTVGALIADSTLALKLRAIVQNLQNTTANTNLMATQLDQFGAKLNSKGTLADKLLTDTSTYRQLKIAINNFQQTSASASTFINNLNTASSKLNGTNSAIGVLLNDPKGAVQVQTSLNNLQQSSIKLNDDLEAVQHNFLLKGFFKKKAKAQADSLKGTK